MALFLKLVCSSWRIQRLVLLRFFLVSVSRKSFLKKIFEYGRLGRAAIAKFLELSLRVVLMYTWKKGGEILGFSTSCVSAQWKERGESVETVERVLVGGLLWLGNHSW